MVRGARHWPRVCHEQWSVGEGLGSGLVTSSEKPSLTTPSETPPLPSAREISLVFLVVAKASVRGWIGCVRLSWNETCTQTGALPTASCPASEAEPGRWRLLSQHLCQSIWTPAWFRLVLSPSPLRALTLPGARLSLL